jgi:GT2 family glycosyltransferase
VSLAAVFVHYHAAPWLARAVASLRADLDRHGLDAEIVVVDNGSRPDEREQLARLPATCLDAGGNRGYAGGLNLGAAATRAEHLFLLNPDVEVLSGCCAALVDALGSGTAVAGPRLYWDRARRLLLPPTERHTRGSEWLRACAPWHPALVRLARGRWRRHARAHWSARAPLATWELSGAFLAVRRDALERVGPFDEGFKLYFEETDWLQRARRHGLTGRLIPAARAVHFYNQSAAREPAARAWFAESSRRFEERHYGRWFVHAKARAAARPRRSAGPCPPPRAEPPSIDLGPPARRPRWVEVSPSPLGYPAAGEPVDRGAPRWTLPEDVWEHLAPGVYGARLVDARGREGGGVRFTRGPWANS